MKLTAPWQTIMQTKATIECPEECPERDRLEKLKRTCLNGYIAALQAFVAFASIEGADCQTARIAGDEARLQWENAATALETHLKDHRCGSASPDRVESDGIRQY
jgi:hypothetical protein